LSDGDTIWLLNWGDRGRVCSRQELCVAGWIRLRYLRPDPGGRISWPCWWVDDSCRGGHTVGIAVRADPLQKSKASHLDFGGNVRKGSGADAFFRMPYSSIRDDRSVPAATSCSLQPPSRPNTIEVQIPASASQTHTSGSVLSTWSMPVKLCCPSRYQVRMVCLSRSSSRLERCSRSRRTIGRQSGFRRVLLVVGISPR